MKQKKILTLQYNPARLKDIMMREGIECKELAAAIGVCQSTIVHFRSGARMGRDIEKIKRIARELKNRGIPDAYSILEPPENENKTKKKETKAMITKECCDYFKFSREPFPSGYLKNEDVLPTENVRKALTALNQAALNSGFVLMTGKCGSGKSTIVRQISKQLKQNKKIIPVIIDPLNVPILGPYEILSEIVEQATAYSVKVPTRKIHRSRSLATIMAQELKNKKSVCLIIDEAQDLREETLISLKKTWERYKEYPNLLSIILVSLPEISFTFNNPSLEQVQQRVDEIQLKPFSDDSKIMLEEMTSYIQHHLRIAGGDPDLFDAGAIKAIAPRVETLLELNNLCCRSIMQAFQIKEKKITAKLIATV